MFLICRFKSTTPGRDCGYRYIPQSNLDRVWSNKVVNPRVWPGLGGRGCWPCDFVFDEFRVFTFEAAVRGLTAGVVCVIASAIGGVNGQVLGNRGLRFLWREQRDRPNACNGTQFHLPSSARNFPAKSYRQREVRLQSAHM